MVEPDEHTRQAIERLEQDIQEGIKNTTNILRSTRQRRKLGLEQVFVLFVILLNLAMLGTALIYNFTKG